ncbi:TRAP transporter substrate-binding protein DctP [Sporosarcina obsidiansis]|uniref:TRAP transporter substrate-binding protein DctP n=1 Tax=Sporosarcina obsidiansis TaxID=2660748 RepID=UPI00129A1F97|nr:TRAP transporter substrate-binding protein DctP [Sporosarcina obsidiansis]
MLNFIRKSIPLLLIIVLSTILSGCGSTSKTAASDKGNSKGSSQTLKVVSFLPTDHQFTVDMVPRWMEKIEEGTNGELTFEWIGGPESMSADEQFKAVQRGIIDIGFLSTAEYLDTIPESRAMYLNSQSPTEMRESGFFDYFADKYKEHDVEFLGRWISGSYYFWSNDKLKSLEDLKGAKYRSNPIYHPVQTGLGMTPITISPGDVYTALERGMVDGFAFPILGPRDNGWTEVTEYIIDEPFLNIGSSIVMNAKMLDSLSAETKERVIQLTEEFENEMITYFEEKEKEEMKLIKNAGVESIKLNKKDSEKFQQVVHDSTWKVIKEKVSSEDFTKLQSFLED